MGLAINVGKVTEVLLADAWHRVAEQSFRIDSYEYIRGEQVQLGGGIYTDVVSAGASWTEPDGAILYCKITAILAVKMRPAPEERAAPRPPYQARTG